MNNEKLEKALIDIAYSDIGKSISGKYTNRFMLNGFIVQRPRFTPNFRTKAETCSFILHQITRTKDGDVVDKTFHVLCFLPDLVAQLKKLEHVCFIGIKGSLERSPKYKSEYCQMFDYEISCELENELEEEYQRGDMRV